MISEHMAVTIVASDPEHVRWVAAPSPLAELSAVLHALSGSEHHPSTCLGERMVASLGAGIGEELERHSVLWSGYRARFLLPGDVTSVESLEAELALLRGLALPVFLEAAAWAVQGGYSGSPSQSDLAESPKAQAEVVVRARSRGPVAASLAELLFDDPERFRDRLVSLLAGVADPVFIGAWSELEARLEHDAAGKRLLAERAGLVAMLASLAPGAQVSARPPRVRIDKGHHGFVRLDGRPLRVVPSVHAAPHLLVKHEPGWVPVVQYPLDQPGQGAARPTLEDLRRRLGALTDPTRLGLCRLIAREAASTTELAARTGMSASQVSRHLRQLRAARVVTTRRDGRFVRYSLDLEGVRALGPDLVAALLR